MSIRTIAAASGVGRTTIARLHAADPAGGVQPTITREPHCLAQHGRGALSWSIPWGMTQLQCERDSDVRKVSLARRAAPIRPEVFPRVLDMTTSPAVERDDERLRMAL